MESYTQFICISDEGKEKLKEASESELDFLADRIALSILETQYQISKEAWEKEFKNVPYP